MATIDDPVALRKAWVKTLQEAPASGGRVPKPLRRADNRIRVSFVWPRDRVAQSDRFRRAARIRGMSYSELCDAQFAVLEHVWAMPDKSEELQALLADLGLDPVTL